MGLRTLLHRPEDGLNFLQGVSQVKKRIIGYDFARALAVFGMVVVNFKIVMGAEQNGPDWLVRLVGMFDGRAAATFVVLAGVGVSLASQRGRASGDREQVAKERNTLLRRALFLFVGGMLYAAIYPADILHFYGIYIGVAAFALAASTRQLWTYSALLVIAFAVMLFALDYEREWDWDTLEYAGFWTPSGMVRHLFYNGFHPVIPWLAFLFVGMVLGRRDMGDRSVRWRVFAWGLGAALAAEGISWFLVHALSAGVGAAEREIVVAIFGTSAMPPMPFYMIAGAGTASAVVAASVALGERYEDAAWIRPFVRTGQLSLTLYVAHVVLGMSVLEAVGWMGTAQTLPRALFAATAFSVVGVVFSNLWLARYKLGPLEAIMHKLTGRK